MVAQQGQPNCGNSCALQILVEVAVERLFKVLGQELLAAAGGSGIVIIKINQ
jgi:hypothetical protein